MSLATVGLWGAAALALGGRLHAEPAPAARASTATVEVIEVTGRGAKSALRFTLALADDNRPSRIEADSGGASYRVSIGREPQQDRTAVVHLSLRRRVRRARGRTTTTEVSLTNRVALRKRVVMGRMERPTGGELRVAVTLQ